eukprot:CAMPEP_0182421438 /NCGR_PEP_ID=MMETSP1167-20130531/6845_1 /TAXON_ID=2988 /ORGANISM="Mallomonas Sp, Strain CCMP3275" /LENGTH=383 /DNA_ID=CAMNT_0024598601 /DNA_START=20 /DNA_END=1171 /DNA_ORIENTATION=+
MSSVDPLLTALDTSGEGAIARKLTEEMFEGLCLTPARRALQNEWIVKNAAPAVDLMEALRVVFSPSTFDQIVDTTVLPKIQLAVSTWSPTTDAVPIHSWIHPWLPLLRSKISCVFPEIRRKLGQALVSWDATDISALTVLSPWKGVFDQSSMDQLLLRSIIPKLVTCLRSLVINPQGQDLTCFRAVMVWADLLPRLHFVSLLEGEFFLKWTQVLVTWLNANPDFEEVTNWYLGWKSEFSQELLEEPHILACFNSALQLMSDALTAHAGAGVGIPPGVAENVSYYRVVEQRNLESAALKRISEIQRPVTSRGGSIAVSFKEVIETFAQNSGVDFIPKHGKFHGGKQVWQFGSRLCYIDQNVVYYHNDKKEWNPIGLEELLLIAK